MKKLAIGCGIATLIIIALGIGVTVFSVRWMKGQVADAERYSRMTERMVQEYGEPAAYVPPADGNYDPARVALFARMRTTLEPVGAELRDEANTMAAGQGLGWLKTMRTMMRLLNAGAGYLATTDSLLLDAGMSHGEYTHLQTLWLHGHYDLWPADFGGDPGQPHGHEEFAKAFDGMAVNYQDEARLMLQEQARNARAAAEALGADCAGCPAWIEYLDEQLDAARARRANVPLLDPLPASLAAAFEQHDFELAATRPDDFGSWLAAILMVTELDDENGNGFNVEFSN